MLATMSSKELTEWQQYFEWREERRKEDEDWKRELSKAERYVNEGS